MEVSIMSVDSIKPFSATSDLKPFYLSLLDQIMPSCYTPLIHFYPNHNLRYDHKSLARKLKSSLSKTLNPFYPLSGRVNEMNTIVHNFHRGVPFVETRIRGRHLVDFLRPPKVEFLHTLLPFEPFSVGDPTDDPPQVAVQVNTFDCGGIAVGLSLNHKIIDGQTLGTFLKTWAAYSINPNAEASFHPLDLVGGSSVFPPRPPHDESLPASSSNNNLLEMSTRRFVFYNNSISALRSSSRSPLAEHPTRVEALYAFIWKHGMRAASAVSGSPKLQSLAQPINMRSSMDARLSQRSIGNLLYPLIVSCKDSNSEKDLVAAMRKGITAIDRERDFNSTSVVQQFTASAAIASGGDQPQLLGCSSWTGFGFNDFEFGIGKPIWTAMAGPTNGNINNASARSCFVVLKEAGARRSGNNDGIEAWITLPQVIMAALEIDPEFLEFASLNPPIPF